MHEREQVTEVKQKVTITNNDLLFHISDYNNNLYCWF